MRPSISLRSPLLSKKEGLKRSPPLLGVTHRVFELVCVLLEEIPYLPEGDIAVLIGIHLVDECDQPLLGDFEFPDTLKAHDQHLTEYP